MRARHVGRRAALQVIKLLARTSGKGALYLALPAYSLVLIVSVILFAPHDGVRTRDVTAYALNSYAARIGLLLGWVSLTLPVSRLLMADPRAFFLRALPVPRWWLLGVTGVQLVLVHVPWLVLWGRGSGVLVASCSLSAVLALQSTLMLGSWRGVLSTAASLTGWWLAPSLLSFGILLPMFGFSFRAVWLAAPEPRTVGRRGVASRWAWCALGSALAVSVYRSQRSAMLRAVLVVAGGGFCASMGLRAIQSEAPGDRARWALGIWTAACLLATATLSRAVLRVEAQLSWVLDSCAVSLSRRFASEAAFLVGFAAFGGVGLAAVLAVSSGHGPFASGLLAVGIVGSGVTSAITSLSVVRLTTRATGRDSSRSLLALLVIYVVTVATLLVHPLASFLFLGGLACGLAGRAIRTSVPLSLAVGAEEA